MTLKVRQLTSIRSAVEPWIRRSKRILEIKDKK
jgi:hypothetical protein